MNLSRLACHTAGFGLRSTGALQVRLDAPQWYWDFGEQVAAGDTGAAEKLLAEYEQLFDTTPTVLPEQPDRERVDAWLRAARRRHLPSDV